MLAAADTEGRSARNEAREGPRAEGRREERRAGLATGARTSGEASAAPGWPSLQRIGPGREAHTEEPEPALALSRALGRSSPRLFRSTCPHA